MIKQCYETTGFQQLHLVDCYLIPATLPIDRNCFSFFAFGEKQTCFEYKQNTYTQGTDVNLLPMLQQNSTICQAYTNNCDCAKQTKK